MLIGLFLFLLLQIVVNSVLSQFDIFQANIYGMIAYYLISSLIIAFFGAILATPSGYKKEFYKQPGFHKIMLIYFVIFFGADMLMLFLF